MDKRVLLGKRGIALNKDDLIPRACRNKPLQQQVYRVL
jgi:hypothetical protein